MSQSRWFVLPITSQSIMARYHKWGNAHLLLTTQLSHSLKQRHYLCGTELIYDSSLTFHNIQIRGRSPFDLIWCLHRSVSITSTDHHVQRYKMSFSVENVLKPIQAFYVQSGWVLYWETKWFSCSVYPIIEMKWGDLTFEEAMIIRGKLPANIVQIEFFPQKSPAMILSRNETRKFD